MQFVFSSNLKRFQGISSESSCFPVRMVPALRVWTKSLSDHNCPRFADLGEAGGSPGTDPPDRFSPYYLVIPGADGTVRVTSWLMICAGRRSFSTRTRMRPRSCPSPARSEYRAVLCVGRCFDECLVLTVDLDPAPPSLRDVDAVLAVYHDADRTVEPAYQRSRVDTGIRLPGVVC